MDRYGHKSTKQSQPQLPSQQNVYYVATTKTKNDIKSVSCFAAEVPSSIDSANVKLCFKVGSRIFNMHQYEVRVYGWINLMS